ncbi:hypothetical protein K1T71_007109 [Dendrolimus kikuchii]|uniref:Uncharacterized protein n=1 Tax=Dendrolimus kikuchii TaxID=765133 RepID=A0ACC1CZU9_9NEOP|nr:hypothetical protein K1T71_007109 [Dendrolimus kikuchii]
MYFQIENTPEHIKKARRSQCIQKELPKEELPSLILAPFSRPPQVVFDNVLIGSTCERHLEVYNPTKQAQQITLAKALPDGLRIKLPGTWFEVGAETCYCVTLTWTPNQPTAMREIIRFTNENRGRYEVIVVLKSVMVIKGKGNQIKGFKISPAKKKKKKTLNKSPVAIYQQKSKILYNSTEVKNTFHMIQTNHHRVFVSKEQVPFNEYADGPNNIKCPFDSPTNDLYFNTSEIFSNLRQLDKPDIMQDTYDKFYTVHDKNNDRNNILKPNTHLLNVSNVDIFDNLTFTPLKSLPTKTEKLDKGPKIIFSLNSENNLDEEIDVRISNKENETHSIINVASSQTNKWLTVNHNAENETQYFETPTIQKKKHPNTSSPKEINSPNFSINTEFSRISDLSFFPQRFSTERKILPKTNNDTQDIIEDRNFGSDTYTKNSPNTPMEYNMNQMSMEHRPPHFFLREQNPKICRQALFRELQHLEGNNEKNFTNQCESNDWRGSYSRNHMMNEIRSPPRSITPPLQSIPEESVQYSNTQVLDNSDQHLATFTINRTFDKSSTTSNNRSTWSKKDVRAGPNLWKVPMSVVRKSIKSKPSFKSKNSLGGKTVDTTFESNKTVNQNISYNQIGNVFSESLTIDPFLSDKYYYDEEAVSKIETEFRRWLNYILTPHADLDSDVEQKIDIGKAWVENRNKEIPLAPTREQASSAYHNSHRLDSLRRSARALLVSNNIVQVVQKLNTQIEKKLIAIRTDRNLHLDIGLQKTIMELLLSYNPLWLRIGLEAIYGLVLPLKSNSDIEGLTSFIIQRMFKNPFLKNKNSKSSAPNMLLPAYMEAIKKFTLKKFFLLVFFLDQAKQRKLIAHDPCLFCRNSICKESREIIIRFTRDLIAGIGDITKHLRPLGYVVSHKQSYLDEYKYAVQNIAVDIRDGVRLTKVMEIILMKNGLMCQLRTPAISRLQKIHNVQVALNALNESDFVIDGDITASDIADGHREKTLSLLWQIIHVFRAPLFEKAANVIKTWWRKKYEVIIEKRKEEERILLKQSNAASLIQYWWRRIQYSRQVEWKMLQITTSTIVIQKYFRMWLCRTHLRKLKTSTLKIEKWYKSVKLIREARSTLDRLKLQRELLRQKSVTIIQSNVRMWLCRKQYLYTVSKAVLIQSLVRRFVLRRQYVRLKNAVKVIQERYRGKLQMKLEMKNLAIQRQKAIKLQSYIRMIKQRTYFLKLKSAVRTIMARYIAQTKMRKERYNYMTLRKNVIAMQAMFRSKTCRLEYTRQRNLIIMLQRKFRAQCFMKKERKNFLQIKKSAIVLQKYIRSYCLMKKTRQNYLNQRKSAIIIQRYFRSYIFSKGQRQAYIQLKNATITLQRCYRSLQLTRQQRRTYLELKRAAVIIQRRYRAQIEMKKYKDSFRNIRQAAVLIQRKIRSVQEMRIKRNIYLKMQIASVNIQKFYKAYKLGKVARKEFLKQKESATKIQRWFRNYKLGMKTKKQFEQSKQASVTIQRVFRAYIISKKQKLEYIRIRTATICIQKYYRSYIEMKTIRRQFIQIKTSTIIIQRYYRSYITTKKHREDYLRLKSAALVIQNAYRLHKICKTTRNNYLEIRQAVICIQTMYRSLCTMRVKRQEYLKLKQSAITIQKRYRGLIAMRKQRQAFLVLRSMVIMIQTTYRAKKFMRTERLNYLNTVKSCISVQKYYRAYITGKQTRQEYLKLKHSTITLQRVYRSILAMRKERLAYLGLRKAAVVIQRRYRNRCLMLRERLNYMKTLNACIIIQRYYKSHLIAKQLRNEYLRTKSATITIQHWYRNISESKRIRHEYFRLCNAAVYIQRRFRENRLSRSIRQNEAANKIQNWYTSLQKRNRCRKQFLCLKTNIIKIQSIYRMRVLRKQYLKIRASVIIIQRYYRSYKFATYERDRYITIRNSVIILQSYIRSYLQRKQYLRLRSAVLTIQKTYRRKRFNDLIKARREAAAICIQKNIKRYQAQSWYKKYAGHVIYIQKTWRGILMTRMIRCEFLQKKRLIITFQSIIRGYLVRKQVQLKRESLVKLREEQRRNWAASKIQALYRGHRVRLSVEQDKRVTELRRRWRAGALISQQETLRERNMDALYVLKNMSDIETVIRAFKSLELLTEVFPMLYNENASSVVRRVYVYMSVTNRSISSIEVLKSGAALLVNLARYRITGPKIYARDRISPILKFMWRFSTSEIQLFCLLSTYIWLFSKYDDVRQDLTEFLHISENHKMLVTIKSNIDRGKRMARNSIKNKCSTPQPNKFISHMNNTLNMTVCSSTSNDSILMPAIEPDYGITRADKPRYFEDAQQAINCLFRTYKL